MTPRALLVTHLDVALNKRPKQLAVVPEILQELRESLLAFCEMTVVERDVMSEMPGRRMRDV